MNVLSPTTQQQVEDNLVKSGVLSTEKLQTLKQKAITDKTPLLSILVSEKAVSEEALTQAIAKTANLPYVNLSNATIDQDVLDLLPQDTAERYMAVPLGEMQRKLVVAMLDANNVQAVDFLANKIGRPLKVYAASEAGIKNIIQQYSGSLDKNVVGDLAKAGEDVAEADKSQQDFIAGETEIENAVQDSPISKALNTILEYAANNRASDVHIEPMERELKIRARIDGVLREIMRLPKGSEAPLVSRIKILTSLKIDEHRIPQDGGYSIIVNKRQIDLRVTIAPVVWGEQIVIRLLDKSSTSLRLEDMGYHGRSLKRIRNSLQRPNGMILTSGPTGSGKTTSMYALLQEIKNEAINIVTLEDPVEYKMEGINQIQVNSAVGLTFATGLRSILRQDPNVIMVGEIRDKETATLAVQAALTGHLVFSTLHTNSAAGILPRLLDMGIEPFLIASTVHTVIGQRLVRRIADKDKISYQSDKSETESIHQTIGHLLPASVASKQTVAENLGFSDLPLKDQNAYTLYKGIDTKECPGGYSGRIGLYEVFDVTEKIQDLILKHSTSLEIQKAALAEGMISMREDGYLKALAGFTTLNEVNRVSAADNA